MEKKTSNFSGQIGFVLAASAVIALGYSIFYFEVKLPNGFTGQLLDIMDYISTSVMMPLIALLSTILIGWVMAPVMMLVLFLQSTGILS